jgi:hypothetical protein
MRANASSMQASGGGAKKKSQFIDFSMFSSADPFKDPTARKSSRSSYFDKPKAPQLPWYHIPNNPNGDYEELEVVLSYNDYQYSKNANFVLTVLLDLFKRTPRNKLKINYDSMRQFTMGVMDALRTLLKTENEELDDDDVHEVKHDPEFMYWRTERVELNTIIQKLLLAMNIKGARPNRNNYRVFNFKLRGALDSLEKV